MDISVQAKRERLSYLLAEAEDLLADEELAGSLRGRALYLFIKGTKGLLEGIKSGVRQEGLDAGVGPGGTYKDDHGCQVVFPKPVWEVGKDVDMDSLRDRLGEDVFDAVFERVVTTTYKVRQEALKDPGVMTKVAGCSAGMLIRKEPTGRVSWS